MKGASANQLRCVAAFSCRWKRSIASRSPEGGQLWPARVLVSEGSRNWISDASSTHCSALRTMPCMLLQSAEHLPTRCLTCSSRDLLTYFADMQRLTPRCRWNHGVTAHQCQWCRGVKPSGFIDTAESSLVVSLTPRSQAQGFHWHRGVKAKLLVISSGIL